MARLWCCDHLVRSQRAALFRQFAPGNSELSWGTPGLSKVLRSSTGVLRSSPKAFWSSSEELRPEFPR
eukprot:7577186-Alexandrium_andersonii.AAC.1